MKKIFLSLIIGLLSITSFATIHVMQVWEGYYKFVDAVNFSQDITIQLGDTVQWLPLDTPQMYHTITSTNIPAGAASFDVPWQSPADTFFQYIPQEIGLYEYECTPHVSFDMIGSITVVGPNNVAGEIIAEQAVELYPNPAITQIKVNPEVLHAYHSFAIHTLEGKLVEQISLNSSTISIQHLNPGAYVLVLIGDRPKTVRFMKSSLDQ